MTSLHLRPVRRSRPVETCRRTRRRPDRRSVRGGTLANPTAAHARRCRAGDQAREDPRAELRHRGTPAGDRRGLLLAGAGRGRCLPQASRAKLIGERRTAGHPRRQQRHRSTRSRDTDLRSDDLVHREFRPVGPDRLWVQDVTQHRTGEGGQPPVVIDAWPRRVVGRSYADPSRRLGADGSSRPRSTPTTDRAIAHIDHGSNSAPGSSGNDFAAPVCSAPWASLARLGQRRRGVVLRFAVMRSSTGTNGQLGSAHFGDVPLDRSVLQPDPPPLHPRLPQPRRFRSHDRGMIPHPTRP